MAATLRYPTGVRTLMRDEATRRRSVERRFIELLTAAGFEEIVLPILDYVEPYASLATAQNMRGSYRFVDRDGDLVAIRSDFTPMVARALAPALDDDSLPLRVFYRGDVIRCETSPLAANREMFQIGGEIVGDASVAADVEAISLAVTLIRDVTLQPLVIFSDTSICDLLAGTAQEARAIRSAFASKRSSALAAMRDVLSPDTLQLAQSIINGKATLDDLRSFERGSDDSSLSSRLEMTSVAERLASIDKSLHAQSINAVLQLDDVDESRDYYTSLRFRIYCGASRRLIAQGGRYDDLYGRFGRSAPAVGFTVTVDDLVSMSPGAEERRAVEVFA